MNFPLVIKCQFPIFNLGKSDSWYSIEENRNFQIIIYERQAGAELGQAQSKLGLKLKLKNVLCCSNSKMFFEDQFDIWYEEVDFEVWIWICVLD